MRVAVRPVFLACCAVEVATALTDPPTVEGLQWVEESPDVTVVVIAGTITDGNRDLVERAVFEAANPRAVVAYGVCASSGGPYWDSVVQGWPSADLFVPGCPPPPPVMWAAVAQAAKQVMAHAHS